MARPSRTMVLRMAALAGGAAVLAVAVWGLTRHKPEPAPAAVEAPFQMPTPAQFDAMSDAQKAAIEDKLLAATADMPPTETDEPLPAESDAQPAELARGTFAGLGEGHHAEGEARLLELADGTRVLRFEDLKVTNGPDLRVLLAVKADPHTAADVEAGYVDLGALKGNEGNQNYLLPEGFDLAAAGSAVIWCRAYTIPFAAAALK
jgi:hypothetical protein